MINKANNKAFLANILSSAILLSFGSTGIADSGHEHRSAASASTPTQFTKPFYPRTVQAAQPSLGQPALYGQWSDVESWPIIAVHANLLPNGKVLAWDATPDDFDDDPHTTDTFTD